MEDQVKLKQETIQTEIIDKDYDKNKFLAYCLSKKPNGDDLSNWTILELNNIIIEFVKAQQINPIDNGKDPQINLDIEKLRMFVSITNAFTNNIFNRLQKKKKANTTRRSLARN